MPSSYLDDAHFLDSLLSHVVADEKFLRRHGHLIDADDFKPVPGQSGGKDRWLIATRAVEHWAKFREPISGVLLAELKEHAKVSRLNKARTAELLKYGGEIVSAPRKTTKSVTSKLKAWKREVIIGAQIEKLLDFQQSGTLDTSRFLEIAREAVTADAKLETPKSDFLSSSSISARIDRRIRDGQRRFYPLMIDPYDAESRAIAPGHLGLILAPYKRGKSLMLLHIALAYAIQRLKVLYITLEDPLTDVEDRLDASISSVMLRDLDAKPKRVQRRVARFANLIQGRVRILDRVEDGISVADLEQIWLQQAESGFKADAVIIDYDDEIRPPQKRTERRHEFADIYRDLRRFAAGNKLLVWTACQTQRGTGDIVRLSADKIAEDISKVRKVACAIGIGRGEPEWEAEIGGDAVHLFIAAHKYDRQNVGVNIASSKAQAQIYDREKTLRLMAKLMLGQQNATANQGGRV